MYVASTRLFHAALLAVLFLSCSSCLKDKCHTTTPAKIYTPIYASLDSIRQTIVSEAPRDIAASGKIYLYNKYVFVNELKKGIHIIDNSNPRSPRKIAFVNIPGNVDMAVNGNVMYVDTYIDLVALDISDPTHVKEATRLKNVFANRFYQYGYTFDTTKGVIIGYAARDTVLDNACKEDISNGGLVFDVFSNSVTIPTNSSVIAPSVGGKGGSTARFGLMNKTLYTIHDYGMQVFNIAAPLAPEKKKELNVANMTETIFPYDHYLFIGGQAGMYIYDVTDPESPVKKGIFQHAFACDPVVVEGKTAYVTLRQNPTCRSAAINELDVLDVTDVMNPGLIKAYNMTSPFGLGIDGGKLFICEGPNGLRFLDAADPANVVTKKIVTDIEAYDVIPHNGVLLVTAKDGLYQYDYSKLSEPVLLSKVSITAK